MHIAKSSLLSVRPDSAWTMSSAMKCSLPIAHPLDVRPAVGVVQHYDSGLADELFLHLEPPARIATALEVASGDARRLDEARHDLHAQCLHLGSEAHRVGAA